MNKQEAEEIFIAAVMSGEEKIAVELTLPETQIFRVLVGRTLKEMERKNHSLYIKAREYAIEYKNGSAIIRKHDADRYKMFTIAKDGTKIPFNKASKEENNEN